MRTKREILLENKWELVRGFCFNVPQAEEYYHSIFVTEEEALPVIAKGIQEFFMRPDNSEDEYVYDLDDAWEQFRDDYSCEHDKEFDEEVEK